MKAKAIIFDKDGTLISFDSFWVKVSEKAIEEVLHKLEISEKIKNDITEKVLSAYGVKDGITDIDGVLSKGTYAQMGEIFNDILNKYGFNFTDNEVTKLLHQTYDNNADAGIIAPNSPDLREILIKLTENNVKLAVVTTDNEPVTKKCLEKLGIEKYFTKIYTDNGIYPTKPDPFCALDFMKVTGAEKDEIIMVGDTETDVKFARNADIKVICIAKNEKNRARLLPLADAVVSNFSELYSILN